MEPRGTNEEPGETADRVPDPRTAAGGTPRPAPGRVAAPREPGYLAAATGPTRDGGTDGGTDGAGRGGPAGGATDGAPASGYRRCWVQIDGPVHYADFGGPAEGPLVVCAHGLGASHVSWLAFAPLLARHARVLAVDLAGFGLTPAAGRRTDVASNQRLLARFLAEVAGGPALLVGHSMGGMIGVVQAALDPASVAGLVLVAPALPRPRGTRPDAGIIAMFAGLMLPLVGSLALARRRRRFGPAELVGQTLERTTADPTRIPAPVVDAMVALDVERAATPDIDAALVTAARSVVDALVRPARLARMIIEVRAPTLLVHGTQDRLVPVAVARHTAARRPDWQVEILAACGHLPQLEAAERTVELVLAWLAGPGSGAARAAGPAARAAAAT
jgi:pimeloyl-ACP methyl ester carboxylesterase